MRRGSLRPAARGHQSFSPPSSPKEPCGPQVSLPCTGFSAGLTRPRGLLASPGWEDSGPWRRGLSPAHRVLDLPRAGKNGSHWALGSGSDSHMCIPCASCSHAWTPGCVRIHLACLERLMMDRSPGSTQRCLGVCVCGGPSVCLFLLLPPAAPLGLGPGSGEGRMWRGCWALGLF